MPFICLTCNSIGPGINGSGFNGILVAVSASVTMIIIIIFLILLSDIIPLFL